MPRRVAVDEVMSATIGRIQGGTLTTFVINPHGRLQEWIAHDKGYFLLAGLDDYELRQHELLSKATAPAIVALEATVDNRVGAFQTYEKGRDASVSCACHWTVNMAATADHGRLRGEAYSVSPCAIVVPAGGGESAGQPG